MNKVILIGRMAADPELRYTQSGKPVSSYRLAVERPAKSGEQAEADFINCVAWNSNAEFASKYLTKGMKIAVEGRISTRNYEDKDGKKIYVTEVVVTHHEFCEKKASGGSDSYASTSYEAPNHGFAEIAEEDDLPF